MSTKSLINEEHLIEWRRHIHENPELSFQEVETAKFLYEKLESFGVYKLEKLTPTSVVATLEGKFPGKCIALRADIDALPILEETDVEFKSKKDGVMHACGHDAHATMLLAAAEAVAKAGLKDKIHGTVKFIFQHAEELLPGGARELVAAGVMDGVDEVYGIHVSAKLPTGAFGYIKGPSHAAPDTFQITIQGLGAHAAAPHLSVDPILVGTELVNALHHIVSRNVNPFDNAVITIGEFTSGNAANVIPDTAFIQGTIRTNNPETRKYMEKRIKETIENITKMHGATYDLTYTIGYDPVINVPENVDKIIAAAKKIVPEDMIIEVPPTMGGEDFSAYLKSTPGSFMNIGVGTDQSKGYGYSAHHPKFKIDEAGLVNGSAMHVQLVLDILGEE
jgi:amidohydrolase